MTARPRRGEHRRAGCGAPRFQRLFCCHFAVMILIACFCFEWAKPSEITFFVFSFFPVLSPPVPSEPGSGGSAQPSRPYPRHLPPASALRAASVEKLEPNFCAQKFKVSFLVTVLGVSNGCVLLVACRLHCIACWFLGCWMVLNIKTVL